MKDNTIVVAGDQKYIWGLWLIIASIRKAGMDEPIIVYGKDLRSHSILCLRQFGDVTVHRAEHIEQSMTCYKPDAMLLAETPYVTWMDSDAIVTGNVSSQLIPPKNGMIFRIRDTAENSYVFRKRYKRNDVKGSIPRRVLQIWEQDIAENTQPALATCGSACILSVERSQEHLMKTWRDLMRRVIPLHDTGVVHRKSKAYFQTDESVLNAVLCFAENVPKTFDFTLDKDPEAKFVHFVNHPKPWIRWTVHALQYFDAVTEIVEWARVTGYMYPAELPETLKKENYALAKKQAATAKWYWLYLRLRNRVVNFLEDPEYRKL